jgi:hypothetical protein
LFDIFILIDAVCMTCMNYLHSHVLHFAACILRCNRYSLTQAAS